MGFKDILSSLSDSERIKETEQKQPIAQTNKITNKPLNDSEIGFTDEAASEDKFGITDYIGGLARFISVCSTPLTISIQGSWGTGKTSIMNLVKQQLPEDVFPVWFNTWQFSQFNMSEELPVSLLTSLLSAFELEDKETLDDASKIIKTLRICYRVTKGFGIAALDSIVGGKVAEGIKAGFDRAESVANENDSIDNNLDPAISIKRLKEEFIKCVNKTLEEKGKRRIVIFIDDLDRLNPGKAVELLEVLKLFLDCKNCVFVLAIDYDVVCRGVEAKYGSLADDKKAAAEKGRSFFDKIIQVPFKMPVARYNIEDYVEDCFKQIRIEFNNKNDINVYVDLIKYSIGTNPRSMKRLFNAYQLLLEIVRKEEICADIKNRQLLFAILCLQHCSESIYNFMIRNSDDLTLVLFNSILSGDYEAFIEITNENHTDIDNLKKIDFDSAKPFLDKLKEAIDLNGNQGIDEDELDNFKNVMTWTAITNASSTEPSTTKKKGSQIVEDYREIELVGNSEDEVKDIIGLIKSINENITVQCIRPNNSDDCIRGKVNGNKTIIDVYGQSKGYAIYLSAPDEETLRDETQHPDLIQLMNAMGVKPGEKSYRKAVRISVFRGETKEKTEENIVKLGKLIYNEWKRRA